MPAACPCGIALTEFNVHTAGTFDDTTDTLDTPSKFSRFGSILANLANNKPDELYVFKFSQGPGTNPGTVKKNGTHFVDNGNSPYNIGGETKGGAVVRLFAKSFAGANDLFNIPSASGTGSGDLRLAASRNTQQNKYYFFSANEATAPRSLTINLASWGIAAGARAIVEEVSADRQGEVNQIITVPANGILNFTQPAQSVLLFSIPKTAPAYVTTLGATDDAMVKAGANANSNFGASANLFAKNDAIDPAARNVTFIKFNTGSIAECRGATSRLAALGPKHRKRIASDHACVRHHQRQLERIDYHLEHRSQFERHNKHGSRRYQPEFHHRHRQHGAHRRRADRHRHCAADVDRRERLCA